MRHITTDLKFKAASKLRSRDKLLVSYNDDVRKARRLRVVSIEEFTGPEGPPGQRVCIFTFKEGETKRKLCIFENDLCTVGQSLAVVSLIQEVEEKPLAQYSTLVHCPRPLTCTCRHPGFDHSARGCSVFSGDLDAKTCPCSAKLVDFYEAGLLSEKITPEVNDVAHEDAAPQLDKD